MEAISSAVHEWVPHSKGAVYLCAAIAAIASIIIVYFRCHLENNGRGLTSGWLVRTAASAAPLPIYVMIILAPLDADIIEAMMQEGLVVAIAGLYGLVETIKGIRYTGRKRPPDHNRW